MKDGNRISRYGPLVLWMALIFLASTSLMSATNTSLIVRPLVLWLSPHASEATINFIHLIVRKGGHFTEYAVLALLAARAFKTSSQELFRDHWFLAAVLLVVVYSLSDEFHQSFVPSRTASIYDSMLDSLGGLVALVICSLFGRDRVPTPPRP